MSRENRPEMHRVIARTTDDRYVTHETLASDLDTAHLVWRRLVDAMNAGKLPLIRDLLVRSCDDPDPRWKNAQSDLVPFFVGRQRSVQDLTAACRKWGKSHGYMGKPGGWIYYAERPRRALGQGWETLDNICGLTRRGQIVIYLDPKGTTWGPAHVYFVNDIFELGQPEEATV